MERIISACDFLRTIIIMTFGPRPRPSGPRTVLPIGRYRTHIVNFEDFTLAGLLSSAIFTEDSPWVITRVKRIPAPRRGSCLPKDPLMS